GYEETARVPILLDWEHFAVPPNDAVLARWKGMRTALLFVGRISPNKRQDDLVRMLAYYRRCIDPEAQLILVGAYRDQPQFRARELAETAEAAAMVGEKTELREALVAAGERRVNDFDPDKVAERMRQVLGL